MRTALDSSVLLDVIVDDPKFASGSERALRTASVEGGLVIGECVLAEIRPALSEAELEELLADWNIDFVASSKASSLVAGAMFERYLRRRRRAERVLPDFLIGAHALHNADRLLARDRGYYRDYFKGLVLLEP
ncbi:MAG: type II toxin-antitoxin system VapC family toxin [Deltaproteobacteria bacterium]|nr:type II toxin-antitoxin system VapC family toxin [Deltaproteobacteria bacterium]MDQ3298057.1 PIN domain-containing protein [Myxococcota bacterium]